MTPSGSSGCHLFHFRGSRTALAEGEARVGTMAVPSARAHSITPKVSITASRKTFYNVNKMQIAEGNAWPINQDDIAKATITKLDCGISMLHQNANSSTQRSHLASNEDMARGKQAEGNMKIHRLKKRQTSYILPTLMLVYFLLSFILT